ncbi:MAG: HAMP domain-containing protein [Oscillospiraceae bacterium]|nr:HAMP domain-containing protein [Oscillospiraceae bacterium]
MFRSLHMKLVMIMLLLIISLMIVVGVFLTNSVVKFYMDSFYQQMQTVFSDEEFYGDLKNKATMDDGIEQIQTMMEGNAGALGINSRTRNYFILDGTTGEFLAGSDPEQGETLEITPNILTALAGNEGYKSDMTASYMDVAMPISGGEHSYIIYILDNRQTMRSLNSELFFIILEALVIGLIISVLLSFLLSKTMTTPIEQLTEAAEGVAGGDFSRKIQVEAKDEIGILAGTFNHMADVLRDTLNAVENERNKLNTLFLHMTDGVVAFSRGGQMIHSNPAATKMLGMRLDEQTYYDDVFHSVVPLQDVLGLQKSEYTKGEMYVGRRSLELLIAPFFGESQAEGGVLVVIYDVTAQRRTEEMRKEFVANVSHELRTPLTNVRSYAETLLDASDLPPDMRENFLSVILSETDRMTHIVQDLLTLSRIDYGKSELDKTYFVFSDAIQAVYQANYMEAKRHHHTLHMTLPGDLPEVFADQNRLEQVMTNVLSNAIKYTPDGGEILISAGQDENQVWMEVSDNGIGIPDEDKDRIFDRFYRVDKARSRESGGTGLGLSIAKEIMLQHGGDIQLRDHVPQGLSVRILLPIEGTKEDGIKNE